MKMNKNINKEEILKLKEENAEFFKKRNLSKNLQNCIRVKISGPSMAEFYASDKFRKAEACIPNDEKIAFSHDAMQFKVTNDGGLYYFQAQNYLGTYQTGYLYTSDNNENELYVGGPSDEKVGFTITINSDFTADIVPNTTTYYKK